MENLPETKERNPAALIESAIAGNADLDKLEKLMVLQERWEANEAKKAYVTAMAAFKATPPRIEKKKKASFKAGGGTTEYSYAILADAADIINTALSEHGLSAAWSTTQEGDKITVICKITHSLGHSETTSLTASPDTTGSKNSIQAIGSTISYLERYTLFALTGLASHDMDDDGNKSEIKYISDEQYNELDALLKENNLNIPEYTTALLKFLGITKLEELSVKQFGRAKMAIKDAIKKAKKNE